MPFIHIAKYFCKRKLLFKLRKALLSRDTAVSITSLSLISAVLSTSLGQVNVTSVDDADFKRLTFFWRYNEVKFNFGRAIYCQRSLRSKYEKFGLPAGKGLTHQCSWHRQVNFELEYLGKLEVICENNLRCETLEQAQIFNDQNWRSNISWYRSFKSRREIILFRKESFLLVD